MRDPSTVVEPVRHSLSRRARRAPDLPPIPPGSEVARLIEANARMIAELRAEVEHLPDYDEARHDELHLLRFLLSHKKKVPAAAKAFTRALEWRRAHNLDAVGDQIRSGTMYQERYPAFDKIHPRVAFHILVTDEGQPILYNSLGETDFAALMAIPNSVAAYCAYHYHMTEHCAILCDVATRRTGRFVKQHKVVDGSQAATKHLCMPYLRAVSAAAKDSEDAYPQLVGKIVVCNFGPFFRTIFQRVALPLMPERLREKVWVLEPIEMANDLSKLLDLLPKEVLPDRLGGDRRVTREEGGPELARQTALPYVNGDFRRV